uniref:Zinc finger PHD-type domain-containing protein n=2 Tax=Caenorhabditis japonica TaxID=281687 RepID=A0A8R1EX41_CAEJA
MADEIDSKGAKKGRTMARRKEREMIVEIAALEKSFKIIGANIRSMEHVAAILSKFADKKVDSAGRDEIACQAEFCLFRDKAMKKASFFNGTKIDCHDCYLSMHAVCAGIWRAEEWQLTHDVDQTFSCLKCSGCSGSVSCMKKAMGTIGSLKRREIEEKKEIEQRRREKEEYVTSGPTRSSLEKVWKKYGADVCAFKQTFCGNHVYKLLHTRAINEYMLVFPPTPNRDRIRDLLLALGDVMKLCVSSALTEYEMDELEDGIVIFSS